MSKQKQNKSVNVLRAVIQGKRDGMNQQQAEQLMLDRENPNRPQQLRLLNVGFKQQIEVEKNKEKQEKLAKEQTKLEKKQRKLQKKINKITAKIVEVVTQDPITDEIRELMHADAEALRAHDQARADADHAYDVQNQMHNQAVAIAQMHHG